MYVSDPPGPPENPKVSDVFKESCVLTWQTPATDGGSPIIGYVIERRLTSSQRWVKANKDTVSELTYKDTDLIEGNEYEFRICAENKVGVGPPSTPTPPVMAKDPWEKPGKPGAPTFSDIKGTSIGLNWTPPESDGGSAIFHYHVEYRVEGKVDWVPYKRDKNPAQSDKVKGLVEDTIYEFRVAAENKAGQGPWSDPSAPVQAKEPVCELFFSIYNLIT